MLEKNAKTVLTVSELNAEVNLLLNRSFGMIVVEGEISNFTLPVSGHMYFTLKDNKSQIRCAFFKNKNRFIKKTPKNGDLVQIRGRIGVYEARGEYQFIAEHLEDAGIGVLQKRFEELKQKLNQEGYFDAESKQPLPSQPKHIGIITSPTGAAVKDILNVLKRRAPHIPVSIYPSTVQGDLATRDLIRAIKKANEDTRCDVIILSRGGGSIEDLWSFNHEELAHAVHASKIPIITGVGHEIDFTIADFVSDVRAPTPSAAAELVSPDGESLLQYFYSVEQWLKGTVIEQIENSFEKTAWLNARLNQLKPANKIEQQQQRTDELLSRLKHAQSYLIHNKQQQLSIVKERLSSENPEERIESSKQYLAFQKDSLKNKLEQLMNKKREAFTLAISKLEISSPLKTLQRGYSITKDESQSVVNSISKLSVKEKITTRLADGEVESEILNIKKLS